ncbi:hypothetical protein B0H11DRAFT_2052268 [Mycena galericulata]|nr:hypothetical protein B0H11DRAFT_2052268 [Mycena galericulata]
MLHSHQAAATETRMNNIAAYLESTVVLLNTLTDGVGTPFVPTISKTTQSVINALQNVKKNKEECIKLMENVHEVLCAIVNLHIKSETPGSLSFAALDHVGKFTETLYKIHTFVEAQKDGSKIKYFFRQTEMASLLKHCHNGLQEAFQKFQIETSATLFGNITEMQKKTEQMHGELLELISTLSDGTFSDRSSSSIHGWADDFKNSSNSFAMLPGRPKIFHGRDLEVKEIVETLDQESARIAILGPGGMGKTSLAKAVLHHPDIVTKYQHRLFIASDSATTSIELAALIGSHVGLKPGKDLTQRLVHYFATSKSCLLILDNLETVWDPIDSRTKVEEFLAVLADIAHLDLIITMRGAERPAKVRWTRPFVQPLKPLSDEAAWKTFVDIAEDCHDKKDITKLLSLTDNVPLVVNLMAHLVESEGCPNVLARWTAEKTLMLSDGHDKKSNLNTSITISLSSPRMTSGAKELLSLLSILPDGLSSVELIQSRLPIQDILACRTVLLRTSMAYVDENKRLKSLVLIREHMQQFHPVSPYLCHRLRKDFYYPILDVYRRDQGSQQLVGKLNQITSNLGNLNQVLLQGLDASNPDLAETIKCIIFLAQFTRLTGNGWNILMDYVPVLEVLFITEVLASRMNHEVNNPGQLIAQASSHCTKINDPVLKFEFYRAAGFYYFLHERDISAAMQSFEKALILAKSRGEQHEEAKILNHSANVKWSTGDFDQAQIIASEAQHLAQVSADLHEEAYALWNEAVCCTSLQNYKKAIILCERARKLLDLCGMSGGLLDNSIRSFVAETHGMKSEYMEARIIRAQIVESTSFAQDVHNHAYALLGLASIDRVIGASKEDVHQNLDKAKGIFTGLKHRRGMYWAELHLGYLHLREGEFISAKTILQKGLDSALKNDIATALSIMGVLADSTWWIVSDLDWCFRWAVIYLGYAQMQKRKSVAVHRALECLGHVFRTWGDDTTAHSLYDVALEGFTVRDIHESRAECMFYIGEIASKRGDLMRAAESWNAARPLFERSLQGKYITRIDTQLATLDQDMINTHNKKLDQLASIVVPPQEPVMPLSDKVDGVGISRATVSL